MDSRDVTGPSPDAVSMSKATPSTPTLVRKFKIGIKHDVSAYPKLTERRNWDQWRLKVTALAKNHEVEDVLNKDYAPNG